MSDNYSVAPNSTITTKPPAVSYNREGYDKFTIKAILTLIGSCNMLFLIGAQFTWGNIMPYVVGYYRDQGYDVNMS
jgi:hypothetical protein